MDPDKNLGELLAIARSLGHEHAQGEVEHMMVDCVRMAELALALDEWLRKGGVLPARWDASSTCGSRK